MKQKLLLAGLCLVLCGILMPAKNVAAQDYQIGHITDPEYADTTIVTVDDEVAPYASIYTIDWSIPKYQMYTSGYFYKKKGEGISINVRLSQYGRAGIISSAGTMYYQDGQSIYFPFTVPADGYYAAFVKNLQGSSITAVGTYTR